MIKGIDLIKLDIDSTDFNKIMLEIDNKLKEEDVPIPARPLRSFEYLGDKFKVGLLVTSADEITDPNLFTNYNIANHVDKWFESMYGEKVKIDLSPGSIVLFLKSELWKMKIPYVMGTANLVCDRNLDKYRNIPNVTSGPPPKRNMLLLIENITNDFASSLTQEELIYIRDIFSLAFDVHKFLEYKLSLPFIKDAVSDFNSSVFHLMDKSPHFGLSKWASLQFIEKLIKSYLKVININFPKIHDIKTLAKIATDNGMRPIINTDLDTVCCAAGVRYGDHKVSLVTAVEAHHAAIRIAYKILIQ